MQGEEKKKENWEMKEKCARVGTVVAIKDDKETVPGFVYVCEPVEPVLPYKLHIISDRHLHDRTSDSTYSAFPTLREVKWKCSVHWGKGGGVSIVTPLLHVVLNRLPLNTSSIALGLAKKKNRYNNKIIIIKGKEEKPFPAASEANLEKHYRNMAFPRNHSAQC